MRNLVISLAVSLPLLTSVNVSADVVVKMETSAGMIELTLDDASAPITVANFVEYAKAGHYDGLVFHRVIPGFMIQGGGMDSSLQPRKTRAPIQNESDNGLSNRRGSVAMARTNAPHSATSQFFINTVNNTNLDGSGSRPGYAVFGEVTSGMDVVDAISAVETTSVGRFRDVPKQPVLINSVTIAD